MSSFQNFVDKKISAIAERTLKLVGYEVPVRSIIVARSPTRFRAHL